MADAGPEHPELSAGLLGRRVVRLWGPLDDRAVNQVAAELMALDAMGDEPVQLFLASSGGPLHLAMSLVDTVDLLGVPVHVTCLGRVEGAAVLLAAVAARRVAARHAQFHLCAPEVTASGNATQIAAWAEQHRLELDRFSERLSRASGRHREHVEADVATGRWLDAEAAVGYGLVDEIWAGGRGLGPPSPRRPLGFGPIPPP
jgi:ATP-dependent Clp protease, protease subunit